MHRPTSKSQVQHAGFHCDDLSIFTTLVESMIHIKTHPYLHIIFFCLDILCFICWPYSLDMVFNSTKIGINAWWHTHIKHWDHNVFCRGGGGRVPSEGADSRPLSPHVVGHILPRLHSPCLPHLHPVLHQVSCHNVVHTCASVIIMLIVRLQLFML